MFCPELQKLLKPIYDLTRKGKPFYWGKEYLLQNKLPSSKSAIMKLEALSEKYVLLDSLLFRIFPEKETAVLAIPEMCTDKIITLYHKSLFAGHQGVIKSYLTISDKIFHTKFDTLP